MQAISHSGQITSISSRADRSIGYRVSTPELTPEEMAVFFNLQNINCEFLIKPMDLPSTTVEVKGEMSQKTQSSRLRSVLFVLWKLANDQHKTTKDAETFYRDAMENFINQIKSKIDELE